MHLPTKFFKYSLATLLVLLNMSATVTTYKYERLTRHNVEPYITVSGLSGGGSLAMMLSFIYSSFIKGAGIFAGGPYPVGIVLIENPVNFFNFTHHTVWIEYLASKGWIDDPYENMKDFRAYVFHGAADQLVPIFLSRFNVGLFKHFGVRDLKDHVAVIPSSHCIPTGDESDHRICSIFVWFAVCACSYSGVNHMFSHLYKESWRGPGAAIGAQTSGNLFKFEQGEFFPTGNASLHGFKEFGFAYVPQRCRPETGIVCKLHFAFHGCGQNFFALFLKRVPEFILETGYLESADENDIIIIFPQAFPDLSLSTYNYIGCFDLYSYTSPWRITFSTKYGVQPLAIKRMFERILMGIV